MWLPKRYDLRPVVPGSGGAIPYWDVSVDPVDEADGGTYYRPMDANWINGSGAPDPDTGDEDDFYLDTTNYQWYGPKGEEDDDGNGSWPGSFALPDPDPGAWLSGAKPPKDTDGVEGDYWLDTAHHIYYGPKGETTWPEGESIYPEWITIGPTGLLGIFLLPGSYSKITNSSGGTLLVYMMFKNDLDEKICDDVLIAKLVVGEPNMGMRVEAIDGVDITHVFVSDDALKPGSVAKVRYKIVGPDGLYWSGSGLMGKLYG